MKFLKKDLSLKQRDEYEFLFSIICTGLAGLIFLGLTNNVCLLSIVSFIPFLICLYLLIQNNRIMRKLLKVEKQTHD
jgi:hypothetical protein